MAGGRVDPVAPAFSELGSGRVPATTRGATPWLVNIVPAKIPRGTAPGESSKHNLSGTNLRASVACARYPTFVMLLLALFRQRLPYP